MELIITIYLIIVFSTIVLDTAFEIRVKMLEEKLGYEKIKESAFMEQIKKYGLFYVVMEYIDYFFSPSNFIEVVRKNINFENEGLKRIKKDEDKGRIRLLEEDELSMKDLVHKIVRIRKSIQRKEEENERKIESSGLTTDDRVVYLLNELEAVYQELKEEEGGKKEVSQEKAQLKQLQKQFKHKLNDFK